MKLCLSLTMVLLLAIGCGPSIPQPTADKGEVAPPLERPVNDFTKANPGYKERAGTFYEKEYLGKALDQLATKITLTDDQKIAARKILKDFIADWLESYVNANGTMSEETLTHYLALMDEKFHSKLSPPDYETYLAWRKGTSGENALAFLMIPKIESIYESNTTHNNRKIRRPPLGFDTVDFSKELWASIKDDHKFKGNVADVLSYEHIEKITILRCDMSVPAGNYLDNFIRYWIGDTNTFHVGPIPDIMQQELRTPLLTILFETNKNEAGLLTIYSSMAVMELNSRYGLWLKKNEGEQPAGDNAKKLASQRST